MNKTYAVTDLHGMYNLWKQIKEYCDETDTIYFLGDAADRGKHGLKIMRELFQDKRVIYIKGNHEGIFSIVALELMEGHSYNLYLWTQNGGKDTIKDFEKLSEDSQLWYLRELAHLPDYFIYKNKNNQKIILSHAGTNPDTLDDKEPNRYGESPWQWDREHFYSKWNPDPQYRNTYIVHGHTPIPNVMLKLNEIDRFCGREERYKEWKGEILEYADGHKFDLDLASFQFNRVALFDLDELKVAKYFYDETGEDNGDS